MATSQHAFQQSTDLPQFANYLPEHPNIDLEHVSVSQLLGRDYIFISSQGIKLPRKNPTAMHNLLNDLVRQLELAETHTVAVTVNESTSGELTFTRHDLTWYKHKVCRVDSVVITNQEQHEFMDMIWRCSTAAAFV
ncbi:MAG TPA: hypothetical protein PK002_11550 [Cellvibrio sp.]|nr:hypothetical protein [Cellvibrio sp.]